MPRIGRPLWAHGIVASRQAPALPAFRPARKSLFGQCVRAKYALFGRVDSLRGRSTEDVVSWKLSSNCSEAHPDTALTAAPNSTKPPVRRCWESTFLPGVKANPRVPQTCMSTCRLQVNLSQPLEPCVPSSEGDVVHASGFGEGFPWWLWCDGPCEPLPNVSFNLGASRSHQTRTELEPAIIYPYSGKLAQAAATNR